MNYKYGDVISPPPITNKMDSHGRLILPCTINHYTKDVQFRLVWVADQDRISGNIRKNIELNGKKIAVSQICVVYVRGDKIVMGKTIANTCACLDYQGYNSIPGRFTVTINGKNTPLRHWIDGNGFVNSKELNQLPPYYLDPNNYIVAKEELYLNRTKGQQPSRQPGYKSKDDSDSDDDSDESSRHSPYNKKNKKKRSVGRVRRNKTRRNEDFKQILDTFKKNKELFDEGRSAKKGSHQQNKAKPNAPVPAVTYPPNLGEMPINGPHHQYIPQQKQHYYQDNNYVQQQYYQDNNYVQQQYYQNNNHGQYVQQQYYNQDGNLAQVQPQQPYQNGNLVQQQHYYQDNVPVQPQQHYQDNNFVDKNADLNHQSVYEFDTQPLDQFDQIDTPLSQIETQPLDLGQIEVNL